MKPYALRNFIPIAGTGNRQPCTGNEGTFRATLGFTPKWFHDRLNVDFSERWHKDPQYRYDTLLDMSAYLRQRFPSIEAFQPDIDGGVDYTCATLSGVEGAMIVAHAYGQTVHYAPDNWPLTDSKEHLSREKVISLKPFDPETNTGFLALMQQMDEMEAKWGKIAGYLNCYQGILNSAFRLRGQDIFVDMIEEPDLVRFLFDHIYHTTLTIAKIVQKRQRDSGFFIDQFSSANCVVNMISPSMYEEFVLPYDRKFSDEFPRYGIHTCNWNATPYIDVMRKINKVGYFDMGMETDMRKAQEQFPDARRGVLYSPIKVLRSSMTDIQMDFERIHRELGDCDIILADIDTDVPDERVQAIVGIANRINDSG